MREWLEVLHSPICIFLRALRAWSKQFVSAALYLYRASSNFVDLGDIVTPLMVFAENNNALLRCVV